MLRKYLFVAFLSALFTTALIAGPPTGGDFVMSNSTIDNGGGFSTGGEFEFTGTKGQPDANPTISVGSDYSLAGCFWAVATVNDFIFSDGFEDD